MRLLARNKKDLWYALRTGSEPIFDGNGHRTGYTTQEYGEPVKVRM